MTTSSNYNGADVNHYGVEIATGLMLVSILNWLAQHNYQWLPTITNECDYIAKTIIFHNKKVWHMSQDCKQNVPVVRYIAIAKTKHKNTSLSNVIYLLNYSWEP